MALLRCCVALLLLAAPLLGSAQLHSVGFEQLDSLKALEPRPVVVFVHTDWCKVCHRMEHTTFEDAQVVKQLNKRFYFVSLDAEQREDIVYRGHAFKYRPTGNGTGVHELATQLATVDGQVNYPTLSVLNVADEVVFQYAGLMEVEELLAVLGAVGK